MILTILKIIGIVILIILLLIILLLSFILLIPIRYRFSAEYFEKPDVFATVRYALVGLNAQVTFKDNDLQYTVKALGGVIFTNTDAKLSWLGRKINKPQDEDDGIVDVGQPKTSNGIDNVGQSKISEGIDDIGQFSNGNQKNDPKKHVKADEKKDQKKGFFKKKKTRKTKDSRPLSEIIEEKINVLKEKLRSAKEKISKINNKREKLLKVYRSKRFEKAKSDVIRYIKTLLKVIKPKHVEGRVHFGLDDPAATGEIIGGLSMIMPLYDSYLDIKPDFEKQIIEGLLKGYGRIRLCSIALIALKVLFNKNLIKVVKRVQNIVEA